MSNLNKFVNENLLPNEEIVATTSIHWSIYLPWALFIFFFALSAIALAPVVPIASIFSVLFCAISWITPYLIRRCTEMVVTNRRIIHKQGLFSRATQEMNLNKVETVQLNQGIFGRMMNYGTLTVLGSGSTKFSFMRAANPLAFRKAFNALTCETTN